MGFNVWNTFFYNTDLQKLRFVCDSGFWNLVYNWSFPETRIWIVQQIVQNSQIMGFANFCHLEDAVFHSF